MVTEDQFKEKKLGLASWYVSNKILLKNILIVFLIIVDFLLLAYFVYLLVFNLGIFQKDYQAILNNLAAANPDYASLRQSALPQDIQIGLIKTYPNNQNYDIVAEITNNNSNWWASFDYQFQLGGELTAKKNGFILPAERKKLFGLATEKGSQVSNIIFTNIKWQKENNFEFLKNERFKFDIKNIQYISSKELDVGDEIQISRVKFELVNNTAFSYNNVNVMLFLMSGSNTIAVNQVGSGLIKSGQTKSLELTFFQSLPRITSVDIVSELNFLDERNLVI
jgi:hypothetical protein